MKLLKRYLLLLTNEIIKTWKLPSFKWIILIPILLCNVITYKNWQMSAFDFSDVVIHTKDPNPWNFLRKLPGMVNSLLSNLFVGILFSFIFQIESKNSISKLRDVLPIRRGVSNLLIIFTIFFWILVYNILFVSVELGRMLIFAKLHPDWGFEKFPMNNTLFFNYYIKTSVAQFSVAAILSVLIVLLKRGFIISSFIPLAATFHWGGYPENERLFEFMKNCIESPTVTHSYNFIDKWFFYHCAVVFLCLLFIVRTKKIIAF